MLTNPDAWWQVVEADLSHWTEPGDRLLLAVSGGADSMGMLSLFINKFEYNRKLLVVGHVNHGLRPDSDLDSALVQDFTARYGVESRIRQVDVPGHVRKHRMSIEAAARVLRYEALEKMATEAGCRWILTGHTQDDSAETVLMRMRNRSPWYEWTGIPKRRGRILRPLIRVSRRQLREWVQQSGVPYREDAMNQDSRFLRSCLRKNLLNHPDFWTEGKIRDYADAGATLEEALFTAKRVYRAMRETGERHSETGAVGLAIDKIFRYFNRLTFLPVEVEWANLAGAPEARLPSAVRQQISQFLTGKGPLARLALPNSIVAERHGGTLWILRQETAPKICQRIVVGDNYVAQQKLTLRLSADGNGTTPDAVHLRSDLAQRDLYLRHWQPGDRIQSIGRPTKKISDILSEQKMDPALRARTLVLADADGPLMILGGAVAQRALDSDATKNTLCISWNKHDGNGA